MMKVPRRLITSANKVDCARGGEVLDDESPTSVNLLKVDNIITISYFFPIKIFLN